jgi:hypothetical protein
VADIAAQRLYFYFLTFVDEKAHQNILDEIIEKFDNPTIDSIIFELLKHS